MWRHERPTEQMAGTLLCLGLAPVSHPQVTLPRQGDQPSGSLVYPPQVVLTPSNESVSSQGARPLVIFATELKAFKWETEVP